MNAMQRPLAILGAAALGGVGLWLAGHWDTTTTGGYWAMLGVIALVGLLFGLAQLRSTDGNAPGMLLVAWLPMTIVALWVVVAEQPTGNWFRDHVREWNSDLGLADVVHYVSPFVAVLAFGIGLVAGLTVLTGLVWRRARKAAVAETAAAAFAMRTTRPAPVVDGSRSPETAETTRRPRTPLVIP